ncbi:MAG: polynucleotide adenylyltransferase PcnB, partial [bacterium]
MIWPLPKDPKSAKQAIAGLEVASKIFSAGFPTYLVGGCVRDSLLGIPNYDVDICTSA